MSASHFFSKDYFQARDRFIKSINELKGQGHQVSHDVLTLDCKGPNQENLCIDIATIGSIDSDNLLLYSSGIHGVEGFAGSAIQLSVLDKLKKQNYECYVLSNWSAETFIGMTDDYPFLQSFNGLLISGEDNMMKPDAEIYELAITRFNLIPQETVFIDDKLENIEAAKKLHLKTIHLIDPNKIEAEIDKFLI